MQPKKVSNIEFALKISVLFLLLLAGRLMRSTSYATPAANRILIDSVIVKSVPIRELIRPATFH
jgi:hypothetical protein